MTIIRTKAQEAAMRIFQETLRRVRADVLVAASCWRDGSRLYVAGSEIDLERYRRVLVLAAGKASIAMAEAATELLKGMDFQGMVVTKHGHAMTNGNRTTLDPRMEIMEAAHPIPDENSIRAGERMLNLAATVGEGDLVLVLLSGGASALMEAPADGVTLQDLQTLNRDLLHSGADIQELNTVRSSLSKLKAGGLARACGDAKVVCLLLSDVIGNDRAIIGSGPCWSAPQPGEVAMEVLHERRVPIPPSAYRALKYVPRLRPVRPEHAVIGDIYTLLEEAQRSAEGLGMKPKVYGRTFDGEAREVGARMAAEAFTLRDEVGKYDCVIAAGETTVTVRGKGRGGRNQELACAAALAIEGEPDLAILAAGTDGTDGPTEAAGGLVDGETYKRTDLRRALDNNDCYQALEAADSLVVTGPTQTNLNDLLLITRVPED